MLLSVTEAAKAAGCARSTIYDKIKSGELSRDSSGKIDTAELLRVFGELQSGDVQAKVISPPEAVQADDMTIWLRNKLDAAELEVEQVRADLMDTQERLTAHREAARSLMSPEQFDDQLQAAVLVEREKAEVRSQEWKQSLAERQTEIADARREAAELSDRLQREADKVQHEADERAKAERLAKALQGRGFIARLLNREPEVI